MEKVELGDPVGNFHHVEKRLKQGITVSRGGVGGGGGGKMSNRLMYNVSKEERFKNSHPYSNNNTAMVYYNGK